MGSLMLIKRKGENLLKLIFLSNHLKVELVEKTRKTQIFKLRKLISNSSEDMTTQVDKVLRSTNKNTLWTTGMNDLSVSKKLNMLTRKKRKRKNEKKY